MDTNGDGVVDANDAGPNATTIANSEGEIQMDTNGDGVVDANDAGPNATTIANSEGEIQMVTNGDGVVDANESVPIEGTSLIIPNSYIVKLKSDNPDGLKQIISSLSSDLMSTGGSVDGVFDQLGVFGLRFAGSKAQADSLIQKLEKNPAIDEVFIDANVTTRQ
jgi:hypothetical protein